MAKDIGVDTRCMDLAQHFLEDRHADDPILVQLLAESIQGVVEDWMEYHFDQPDKGIAETVTGILRERSEQITELDIPARSDKPQSAVEGK